MSPPAAQDNDAAGRFEPHRPRLTRIADRMLGSGSEAEDVVQEAFSRWPQADREAVRDAEAFLVRTTTRLSLDVLKSARHRRETYPGPWLPDPVVEPDETGLDDDVTLPLLLALERLSPLERAAFLLHDVFGMGFDSVAEAIGRDEAACRQLAARARRHVREERPRFPIGEDRGLAIAEAFFTASRRGELDRLKTLLTEDVRVLSDGGGRRPAAIVPIEGLDRVMTLHNGLARMFARQGSALVRYCFINGLPGFVTIEGDGLIQTTALDIADGLIRGIYITRNPDKLAHLADSTA